MIAPGARLGRYEIRSKIGEGGMGQVYLAQDLTLDRKVALKILPAAVAADRARLTRFVQEAKAASALNHPNILTIHEIGESEFGPFMVTEFIDGDTLRDRLRKASVPLNEALDIAAQIARALMSAHDAGIIHRDIKPENVMVRRDGIVKVLDFGLAKLLETAPLDTDAETQMRTQGGLVMGTVPYMSPEQARGLAVDARTDLFSLGSVLYEMLTGRQPFAGETISHTVVAILEHEPQPLMQLVEDLPGDVEAIVGTALRKTLDDRYQSAEDLLADLTRVQKQAAFARDRGRTPSDAPARTTASTPSIAILPFANISADPDNEYFCDGLAEELLNALAKIEHLRVAARTSTFSFKGRHANVGEIASALNVSAVLEGSVRKSGNRVRITTQLVNAADGYHIWSERYDRDMKDIFEVQDEITAAVVTALKVKLLGEKTGVARKRQTGSPEAYERYLRGLSYFHRFTAADFQKAADSFRQAVALDPGYAAAYAGLADAYTEMSFFSFSPHEWMPKAREAARKALELDETLSEAHNSLAIIKMYYDWDFPSAEHEFTRALALNPGSALIHMWHGWYLGLMGRFDESFAATQRAQELDPLSDTINSGIGIVCYWSRQPERATRQFHKVLELNPSYSLASGFLAETYAQQGNFASAIAIVKRLRHAANDPMSLSTVGYVYARAGDGAKAREILSELETRSRQGYVSALNFAQIHMGLGECEQALTCLEKACNERSVWLTFLKVDPKFDPLRPDPRFQDVLRRVGFAP